MICESQIRGHMEYRDGKGTGTILRCTDCAGLKDYMERIHRGDPLPKVCPFCKSANIVFDDEGIHTRWPYGICEKPVGPKPAVWILDENHEEKP